MAEVVNHITLYEHGYAFLNDEEGSIVYHFSGILLLAPGSGGGFRNEMRSGRIISPGAGDSSGNSERIRKKIRKIILEKGFRSGCHTIPGLRIYRCRDENRLLQRNPP